MAQSGPAGINSQQSALTRALRLLQNGLNDPVASRPRSLHPELSTRDFGAVIGAKGPSINWRLVTAFGCTLLVTLILSALFRGWVARYDGVDVSIAFGGVFRAAIYALVLTGAAVVAFRSIRFSATSVLAAAAITTLVLLMYDGLPRGNEEQSWWQAWMGGLMIPFFVRLIFFGGLTWSIARITPLFWALSIGYFGANLVANCVREATVLIGVNS